MEKILLFIVVILFASPDVNADFTFANNTEFDITRTGCGATKLCVETPSKCDPAGNSTCLFGSANATTPVPPNGVQLAFELSGNSAGFIALGLTANANQASTIFICGQNNSEFFFQTMTLNNTENTLTPLNMNVTEIRSKVNGSKIQCEFTVSNLNASTTRSTADTTFVILLGTGTVQGGVFNFTRSLTTNPLDLSNPSSNIGNTTNATTVPPTTTTSGANHSLHFHAVLFLLSMLALSCL